MRCDRKDFKKVKSMEKKITEVKVNWNKMWKVISKIIIWIYLSFMSSCVSDTRCIIYNNIILTFSSGFNPLLCWLFHIYKYITYNNVNLRNYYMILNLKFQWKLWFNHLQSFSSGYFFLWQRQCQRVKNHYVFNFGSLITAKYIPLIFFRYYEHRVQNMNVFFHSFFLFPIIK